MGKFKVSDFRRDYPMYDDLTDEQILSAIHKKHYADLPVASFMKGVDWDTERDRLNPVKGMGGLDTFRAGAGKALADVGRSFMRAGNTFGLGDYDQSAAKADQDRDKALMDTTAGTAGNIVGNIAMTASPALRAQQAITRGGQAVASVLPKTMGASTGARIAAPFVGAAGSGAMVGAATNPENMSRGAGMGAAAGVIGEGGGRVAAGLWNGGKAMFEPLYQAGRDRILRRTMERFADNMDNVRAGASNPTQYVRGGTPTLAEATMDSGIAQLQRGAQSASPDVASALAANRDQRLGIYRNTLDSMRGGRSISELEKGRADAAKPLYDKAISEGASATPEQVIALGSLMESPSFRSAMQRGELLARDAGEQIRTPLNIKHTPARSEYDPSLMTYKNVGGETTVTGNVPMNQLHYAKMGLDDMIGSAKMAGNNNEARILSGLQERNLGFMNDVSPTYGVASELFRDMSAPINRKQVANHMYESLFPAITDFSESAFKIRPDAYARALRDKDATARAATGMSGAKMDDIMYPHQIADMEGIGKDIARSQQVDQMGAINGSRTAQNLAAGNVVEQLLGGLGMPRSFVDSQAGRLASGVLGLPYRLTQGKTEQQLGKVLTDPSEALRVLNVKDPTTFLERAQPYTGQFMIQLENN